MRNRASVIRDYGFALRAPRNDVSMLDAPSGRADLARRRMTFQAAEMNFALMWDRHFDATMK